MGKRACLDTGVIILLYSKDCPDPIDLLFKQIKLRKIEAHVVFPILSEVYYHICKENGKQAAEVRVASFLNKYPVKVVNLNQSLVLKAGDLKCSYSKVLSYNDCFAISYALNKKFTFHTTEKSLKKILPTLKLKTYDF